MKKRIVMIALAVVAAFSATGCSKESGDVTVVEKPSASVVNLSTDWKDMQFLLGDKLYKVPFNYMELASEGWSYENANDEINNQAKELSITLRNPFYNNNTSVGLVNNTGASTDGKDCTVFRFEMNIKDVTAVDDLHIAGGLGWGSSYDQIKAVWGDAYSEKDVDANAVKLTYYDANKNTSVELLIDKATGLYGVKYESN